MPKFNHVIKDNPQEQNDIEWSMFIDNDNWLQVRGKKADRATEYLCFSVNLTGRARIYKDNCKAIGLRIRD